MGKVKTTVEISDSLFTEAKAWAASHDITFRQIVEEGLRTIIQRETKETRFQVRDGSFGEVGSTATKPWSAIRAMIYEGRGE
jgi:hypothetical protein